MARCGCSGSTSCPCLVVAGTGIDVTGNGQAGTPFVISSAGNATTVDDTTSIDSSISGTGTAGDPYVISSIVKIDPAAGNVITLAAGGIRVDCATIAAECGIQSIDVADTSTVDLTLAAGIITADVILDPDPNNLLEDTNGLTVTCDDVRTCFVPGQSIDIDPATGQIDVCLSADAGQTAIIGTDGCILVPMGGNVAVSECGLAGDGSAGDPLRANVADWPWACDQFPGTAGQIYCNPFSGQLEGEPPAASETFVSNGGTTPGITNIPGVLTTVDTATIQLVNPSSCRDATALIVWEADVTIQPAANTGVDMLMNGDGMVQFQQTNGTVDQIALQQARAVREILIPAGGVFNFSDPIQVRETLGGGSTYSRTQWRINAIVTTR